MEGTEREIEEAALTREGEVVSEAGAPRAHGGAPDGDTGGEGVSKNDAPRAHGGAPDGGVLTEGPASHADGDASQRSIPATGTDSGGAIEEELGELVKTAAERDEYLALAQRTQADFENYRKRVARDAAQAQGRGVAKLAKELLPALDNLDRAIEAAEEEDPLLAGVRLVRSELGAALARLGIEAFAPLGEVFDPTLHDAVAQQPVGGAASGTVAEVFQNGYRMGETIIRPARVLVAA
jgi:molecular chaperone GrpE